MFLVRFSLYCLIFLGLTTASEAACTSMPMDVADRIDSTKGENQSDESQPKGRKLGGTGGNEGTIRLNLSTSETTTEYQSDVGQLWDGVLLVLLQKSEVQYVSKDQGVIVKAPYFVCIVGDNINSSVSLIYMKEGEQLTAEDQTFRLNIFAAQIGAQLSTNSVDR